jgi:hypothetical protein
MSQPASYPTTAPKKSNTTLILVIIIVVVVAVGVVGGALFVGNYIGTRVASLPKQHTANIVNGVVTVSPGTFQYYQFSVPTGASDVFVNGTFLASGGSGNDIIVLIMDNTNFINWENGHQATAFYNSGQITTATFTTVLPNGGLYDLVYSNTFSTFSTKNVQTTANLYYSL